MIVCLLRCKTPNPKLTARTKRQRSEYMYRTIRTRWVQFSKLRHSSMMDTDFAKKHEWLKSINDEIKTTKEIPSWLQL